MEIFLLVADKLNFSAAAQDLGLSQSAVSQAIARIEDCYHAALFDRRPGQKLALTPVGCALLPTARSILHLFERQVTEAIAAARGDAGTLAVGFYPGIASGPFRQGLLNFTQQSPAVRLRISEGSSNDLAAQVAEGVLAIAFTAFAGEQSHPNVLREELWREPLLAVLPHDHPLAGRRHLRWRDIIGEPIILRQEAGNFAGYKAIVERVGMQPERIEFHPVSRGALFELVSMGLGVSVTFASAAPSQANVVCVPITGARASAGVEAMWVEADNNPLRHRLLWHVRRAVVDQGKGGS